MYFRGGDILRENAHELYSQAPCSLLFEAFNFVNATRYMLVFDPKEKFNPCIDVVRSKIPESTSVSTPCHSIGCHMTLLGRASYVVVSGFTTFAPREYGNATIKICVAGNTSAFKPWSYTETTKIQMLTTRSEPVLDKYNVTSIRVFINESAPHECGSSQAEPLFSSFF
ncbi:hypothetical protein Naga_100104g24 [Nannochloropsis gaditana]|uniref:Uncharacterized protein n=1 Tax=Nannochloropsis gaditana TaxID=72520 RepID=W7U4M9_9STRA|nr:hypothetical protein Naga_100104g24 [Nannochloropsis gaditana]